MNMTLDHPLAIHNIGYKNTFTGDGFMIEFNVIVIRKGFSWDGASHVGDGKRENGRPITWRATCVHDILYRRPNPLGRKVADTLFYKEMVSAGFKRAYLYYLGVRAVGWMFYKGNM